jgi:hypothetical protein
MLLDGSHAFHISESMVTVGWYRTMSPCTATFTDLLCSPSDFYEFLIHPPELSGSKQQISSSKAEEIWQEVAVNFVYELSVAYSAGF